MVSHPTTHGNTQIARPFQVMQPGVPLAEDAYKILRTEYPPQQWIIPGLIPRDFHIISAPPKAGKSMFALMCALKVATMPAPKDGSPPPCAVVISPDDTDRGGIQERINMLLGGVPLEPGRLLFWFENVEPLGGGLEAQLAPYLEAHPNVVYVVIDVLNSVKPERTTDDIQKHDHAMTSALRSFRQRYPHIGLGLLNHNNKREGGDRAARISGSYGLTGGVDTYMIMDRDDDSDEVDLYRRGRRGGDAHLHFSLSELSVDWEPPSLNSLPEGTTIEQEAQAAAQEREEEERRKRPHVPGPIEQKLLDVLAEGEWAPKALAEAANVCRRTARSYLRRMLQRGQVQLVCGGVYRLGGATSATLATPLGLPGFAAPLQAPSVADVASVAAKNGTHPTDVATPPKTEPVGAKIRRYLAQGVSRKKAEELALIELKADVEAGRC